MKFNPPIIFFLIIVFFVLSSVVKKNSAKKRIKKISAASVPSEKSSVSGMKTEAKTSDEFETASKHSSILWKIVLQARQFIGEAQKRVEEQRQLQKQNHVDLKNKQGQNQTGNLKQAGKNQETIWDILAERTDDDFEESKDSIVSQSTSIRENSKSLQSATEKRRQSGAIHLADAIHLRDDIHPIKSNHTLDGLVEPGVLKSEKTEYSSEGMYLIKEKSSIAGHKGRGPVPDKKYCFKTDPLQNAVIWSEILSKPVALKNNS